MTNEEKEVLRKRIDDFCDEIEDEIESNKEANFSGDRKEFRDFFNGKVMYWEIRHEYPTLVVVLEKEELSQFTNFLKYFATEEEITITLDGEYAIVAGIENLLDTLSIFYDEVFETRSNK